MQHFGGQRTHPGYGQRPPVFFDGRRSRGCICSRFNGIGLHAQGFYRRDNRRGRRQVMGHAQYPVDQVELQLLHTRQLAQFVLDQGLLGGAVHRFDAKTAQARTRSGSRAELDHAGARRC